MLPKPASYSLGVSLNEIIEIINDKELIEGLERSKKGGSTNRKMLTSLVKNDTFIYTQNNIKEDKKREMTDVSVQYVYDEKGRRTGVIIPTELWNEVKGKIEVEEKVKKKEVFTPSEYRGIYKDLEANLEEEARSLREE